MCQYTPLFGNWVLKKLQQVGVIFFIIINSLLITTSNDKRSLSDKANIIKRKSAMFNNTIITLMV